MPDGFSFSWITPMLAMMTLLVVVVFAIISKERAKERQRDPNAPISSLAKDGKYGGVGFLLPLDERAVRTQHMREDVQRGNIRREEVLRDDRLRDTLEYGRA